MHFSFEIRVLDFTVNVFKLRLGDMESFFYISQIYRFITIYVLFKINNIYNNITILSEDKKQETMDTKNIIYIIFFVLSSAGISKDIVSILCVDFPVQCFSFCEY